MSRVNRGQHVEETSDFSFGLWSALRKVTLELGKELTRTVQ